MKAAKVIDTRQEVYMNYVKAFAIIAMVCGHAASPLNPYIYQYHMALFMFTAGYFYKDYYSEHPITLIGKRIKSLYLPFLGYNILFIFVSSIFKYFDITAKGRHVLGNIDIKQMLKSLLSFNSYADYLGGFWFVKTLFFTTVMFCIISFALKKIKLNKEIYRAGIILIIYVIEWILIENDINLSKNLVQAPMTLPIFYFGYLYNKYKEKFTLNWYSFIMAVWIIYADAQMGIVDIDSLTFTGPIFYIVSSLAGTYVNVYVANFIFRKWKNITYINFIGKSTYTILAVHLLTQDVLKKWLNAMNIDLGCFLWIVDVVIAVNVSILIHYVYLACKRYIQGKVMNSKERGK